ncbi:MAG: sigma-70 family RNA polymerase sigma factor [Ardenticatenales bacterium]
MTASSLSAGAAWPLAPRSVAPRIASDGDLAALAAAGDHDAFESIVRRHGRYVHNLACATLGDAHEAEDAAQETFVRAWRALSAFRADAQLRTWLYRIAMNVCYDRLPRLRRDIAWFDTDEDDAADAWTDDGGSLDDAIGRAQLATAVRAAVDELPSGYRLLLTLRHFDDLSYDEIAGVTGLPIGTVKTGIHRGRGQLRRRLADLGTAR